MDSIPASAVQEGGKAPTQTEFPLSGLDSFPSISFFRSKSPRIEIVQLYNYLLRRKKSWFRRINLLGGMSNCNVGASTSVDGLLLPQWKTFSWWRLMKMGQLTRSRTRWFSSLERLGRTCSPWTTVIRYQHFNHLQSVWDLPRWPFWTHSDCTLDSDQTTRSRLDEGAKEANESPNPNHTKERCFFANVQKNCTSIY